MSLTNDRDSLVRELERQRRNIDLTASMLQVRDGLVVVPEIQRDAIIWQLREVDRITQMIWMLP